MVKRLVKPSKNNSFFLFGARGTGKSTFIKEHFPAKDCREIDLLNPDLEEQYSKRPMMLFEEIKSQTKKTEWVFIDEVQKVPKLLDVVHMSIEKLKQKFILTGSSARKLKRGSANMLAGRAFLYSMFPLSYLEIENQFELAQVLKWGSLPKLQSLPNEEDKAKYLKSYGQVYLKEEIKEEQLVRNIEPFREFLEVSAQMSGKIINYNKIGNDIGVDHKTVQTYFEILSDTWIGFFLPAFHQSVRKSQKLSPKFYYFDLGVKNSLGKSLHHLPSEGTSSFGDLFEHFLINEVYRLNEYFSKDFRLSYLATKNGAEIDLILSRGREHFAIEIKASSQVDEVTANKLSRLAPEIKNIKGMFLLSNDPVRREIASVNCLPWQDFLREFKSL
jgi:uncharacterized protein